MSIRKSMLSQAVEQAAKYAYEHKEPAMTTNAQDAPTFRTEADLIAFLDSLHATTETGAATSEKWEPAQRAIRALRAGGEAVAWIAPGGSLHHSSHVEAFGFANVGWRPLYAAPPAAQPERAELDRAATIDAGDRCSTCDGTGSVHRADGEYCGECPFCKPAPAGDAVALVRGSWLHTSDVLTLEQITSARYTLNDERLPADVRDYLRGLAGRIPNVPTAALNAAALQSSGREGMVLVPRDEVERLMKVLRYASHPMPSPHADYLQSLLAAAPRQDAAQEKNRD